MLSLERKLQDTEYKEKYDISNNTYEEIRPYLFKNPVITKYISIIKVSSMLKAKEKKNNEAKNSLMDYENYDISKYILEKDLEKDGGKLNKAILESLENDFSNKHLNIAMFHYETMTYLEVKAYIKLLTKAFYLIDKYKDSDFSREILRYLNTINHYKDFKPEEELDVNKENIKDKIKTEEDLEKLNAQVRYLTLHNKYMEIKNILTHFLNGGIYSEEEIKSRVECYLTDYFYLYKYKKAIDVFNLLDDEVTKDENITKPLENKLNNVVHEAKSVYKLKNELDDILETKAEEYKVNTSITPKEEKIITDKITEAIAILDKYDYRYLDYLNFNTITYLLAFNKETKEFLKDVNTDLSLENPVKPKDKKKAKKIVDNENISDSNNNREIVDIEKPKKAPSLKELREEYKETTKKEGDYNFKRNWALLDNSKLTTNVINMREQASNIIYSSKELTKREIAKKMQEQEKIKQKKRINNKDRDKLKKLKEELKELEVRLEEQEKEEATKRTDLEDKKEELDIKTSQIFTAKEDLENETDTTKRKELKEAYNLLEKDIKKLNKEIKKLEEELSTDRGLNWQLDAYNNMLVYKKDKRNSKGQKESYKLMVAHDYNLLNLNLKEVANFLIYIPNIPNIEEQLEEDYITLDLEHYIDFFNDGLTQVNISRTRRDLLNGLVEARKESYDYSFYDSRGKLQEGSLVLFGDVLTTEYKGKGTVKVQLGAKFKENIKNAFINGELVEIKREALTNSRTKVEANAKKLAIYFTRLARNEAKKGLKNGIYEKDFKIGTIIEYLREINAINYDPSRYNQFIREPLEHALYTGIDKNYFTFETRAFDNYDKAINTLNNGANAKDKIENFENEGITIKLNAGNVANLDKNEKAYNKYTEKINKAKARKEKATEKALEKEIAKKLQADDNIQDAIEKATKGVD